MLVFIGVQSVADVPSPRPAGWVTDQANVIDAAAESRMNAIADELHKARGIELAIVTVDNVPGTPKAFATELFNYWRIGQAATNNGVLVLLVMGQRRLEIETGTGIELALPATWLAGMQASTMVPRFKQADFGGGLVAGVEAIAAHVKAAPGEAPSTAPAGSYESRAPAPVAPVSSPPPPAPRDRSKALEFAVGSAALGGIGGGLWYRHRRRRRHCDKCKQPMLPLSEIEDDQHLSAGQRTEEGLGSVDYEVLVCPRCQASKVLRHARWLSDWDRCGKCSFKTLKTTTTTTREATYDHGGEVQVHEHCRHCNHASSHTRYTARRSRPSTTSSYSSSSSSRSSYSSSSSSRSSSSSSRSSGYSGGSSSGGGAGSSW